MWFSRLLYGMLAWTWQSLMRFCIVIMQVGSASMQIMHKNADAKGIVSVSQQADEPTVFAQLARVQEENLQLRRRLNILEELLVSTSCWSAQG